MFEYSNFSAKAEDLIKFNFDADAFYAIMCNSIAFGAEAIDISMNQDVFGIDRSNKDAFYFNGHEFMIYLLKQALQGTSAFQSLVSCDITESFAEYYLFMILWIVGFLMVS